MRSEHGDIVTARRMLEHVTNGTTHLAPDQYRIPVQNYVDPTRWQQEVDQIFLRKPVAIAFSAELPAPRAYKAMEVMGIPLLIVRGEDGLVRCFLNVCRHRGAIVAKAGCGRAKSFSCPYHGWTFDSQGKLASVHQEAHFGEVDRDDLGLKALVSEERDGIVYAVLTPGVDMDLDGWLGDFAPIVAALDLANCHFFGESRFAGPNWKIAMDGYLEIYHFDILHKDTFATFIMSDVAQFDPYGNHMATTACSRTIGELRETPESAWRPKAYVNTTLDLFPNTIIGFLFEGAGREVGYEGGMVQIERIFPGSEVGDSITIQTILSTQPLIGDLQHQFAKDVQTMARRGVETEDYRMGFGVQAAATSGANGEYVFGRNEIGLHHFHRTIDNLLR